jgi:hypothetical protein
MKCDHGCFHRDRYIVEAASKVRESTSARDSQGRSQVLLNDYRACQMCTALSYLQMGQQKYRNHSVKVYLSVC